jgi:hypothetical protein
MTDFTNQDKINLLSKEIVNAKELIFRCELDEVDTEHDMYAAWSAELQKLNNKLTLLESKLAELEGE